MNPQFTKSVLEIAKPMTRMLVSDTKEPIVLVLLTDKTPVDLATVDRYYAQFRTLLEAHPL
jgi:hypothetical protein